MTSIRHRFTEGLLTVTLAVSALCTGLFPLPAAAADTPGCPDAAVISGNLITNVDWDAVLPIRIAGITVGGGSSGIPSGAANETACVCNDSAGVPHPGFTMSMWAPAQLEELVRVPGCMPTLGAVQLKLSNLRLLGTAGRGDREQNDGSFYHYHSYSFPLLYMLNLLDNKECMAGGYTDLDLMYMSELDPTWNNDDLAFFANPEAAAVANPIAQSACPVDATAAMTGSPLDSLFWCAGSWGGLYPLSGNGYAIGSLGDRTSLLATRAIAAQTRRGLMYRTIGNDALCNGVLDPTFTKSGYKMSEFFPIAEGSGTHPIGQTSLIWGEYRQVPGTGEDAVYILWRWVDCCAEVL